MKILKTIWFTQMISPQTIGIVIGEDEKTGERKAFIGAGHGVNEKEDAVFISSYGAKVHLTQAEELAELISYSDKEVCPNCDSPTPEGCGGKFKYDDGKACMLNKKTGIHFCDECQHDGNQSFFPSPCTGCCSDAENAHFKRKVKS